MEYVKHGFCLCQVECVIMIVVVKCPPKYEMKLQIYLTFRFVCKVDARPSTFSGREGEECSYQGRVSGKTSCRKGGESL